jgi:hypothetical protein
MTEIIYVVITVSGNMLQQLISWEADKNLTFS